MGLKKRPYSDKSDKPKRGGDSPKRTSKSTGAKGFGAKKSGSFGDDKKRSFSKTGDKKPGSFGKDKRSFDDKPKRSYGKSSSGERPSRPSGRPSFKRDGDSFDDKPKRSYNKSSSGDRPSRPSSRPSYNKRDGDSEDRPKRTYNRSSSDDRPSRPSSRPSYNKRDGDSEDRPKRTYNRSSSDDRPSRPSSRPSYNKRDGDSEDRPKRTYNRSSSDDRPSRPSSRPSFKRDGDSEDRPKRTYNRSSSDDRPSRPSSRPSFKRDGDSDDRPKRTYNRSSSDDRPSRPSSRPSYNKRDGDSEDRPKRSYTRSDSRDGDDRKPREYKSSGRTSRDDKSDRRAPIKDDSYKTKTRLRKEKPEPNDDPALMDEIRLNRYISNAGVCSRREADDLIGAGLVSVNGEIITEMGYKVKPGDEIRYNNERLSWEKKVYLVMNKPKDSITTAEDPEGRRTVMDLINDPKLPRVYPVGRLDRNTTGVLLLTNDGELAQRMMHPKYLVTKVYKATLNKNLHGEDLWKLQNGVELEDGFIKPDAVAVMDAKAKNEVMVQIHSGRNRIIHRIFESLGYTLDKLDRIQYADLEKKGLGRSIWRHLTDKELKKLKKLVNLK